MRKYLLILFLATATGASAAALDGDTLCATVYTYLAESARQNGMSGDYFDNAALKAEEAHLALNPSEERKRYTLEVINQADGIRDGMARATIKADSLVATATRCNARYFSNPQTQAQRAPDDPDDPGDPQAVR